MQKGMGTLGRPAEESRVEWAEEWVPVDEMNKEDWSKGWGGEPHPQRRDLHSTGGEPQCGGLQRCCRA